MVIASQKAVKNTGHLYILYGDSILNQERSFNYLSVIVDESLSWNSRISYFAARVYPKLKLLNRFSSLLGPNHLFEDTQGDNLTYFRLRFYHMGILH